MACLLLLGLSARADSKQVLTINGETVEKVVTRITFSGDNVVLTFGDQTTQTVDMEMVTLTISLDGTTDIGTVKEQVGDVLDIDGLEPGTEVVIYNAQGRKMLSARASDVRAILQTHALKSGVYVLKAGNQIVKFIKR